MQIPKRKSAMFKKYGQETDYYLSVAAIQKMRDDVERLEKISRPRAVEDLSRAREMGDLSENAAYTEAKARLTRIDYQVFEMKEKLKFAIEITPGVDANGRARIGSTVVVRIGNHERTYLITGAQETDPAHGKISHVSPVGMALLGHKAGDEVTLKNDDREIRYQIIEVY